MVRIENQSIKSVHPTVRKVARAKSIPLEGLLRFGAYPAKRQRADGSGEFPVCRLPIYDERGEEFAYYDLISWGKGLNEKNQSGGLFLPDGGRLPKAGEIWCVVEGPKDAGLLLHLGAKVVGLPTNYMASEYARLFEGVHVVIVTDLDDGGRDGARKTACNLWGVAASIRVAQLPGEHRRKSGLDARDVCKAIGPEGLKGAIKAAEMVKPEQIAEWRPPERPKAAPVADFNRFITHDEALTRFTKYLATMPREGDEAAVAACRAAAQFDIDAADAIPLLAVHCHHRNGNPFTTRELESKLSRSERWVDANGRRGIKLRENRRDWPPKGGSDGAVEAAHMGGCPRFSVSKELYTENLGQRTATPAFSTLYGKAAGKLGLPSSQAVREPNCSQPIWGFFTHLDYPKVRYAPHRCGRRDCPECAQAKLVRWANHLTVDEGNDPAELARMTYYSVEAGQERVIGETGIPRNDKSGAPMFRTIYRHHSYGAGAKFWTAKVASERVAAIQRSLRRTKLPEGTPREFIQYVVLPHNDETTTIVATVEFAGESEIALQDALVLVRKLTLEASPEGHPVRTSRGWSQAVRESAWKLEGRPRKDFAPGEMLERLDEIGAEILPCHRGIEALLPEGFDVEQFLIDLDFRLAGGPPLVDVVDVRNARRGDGDLWQEFFERFPPTPDVVAT